MAKRHSDALAINMGACNPSGIAHAIIEACAEMRSEPGFAGTDAIRRDPAIRLMVNQLSYLMDNGEMPWCAYRACIDACNAATGDDQVLTVLASIEA